LWGSVTRRIGEDATIKGQRRAPAYSVRERQGKTPMTKRTTFAAWGQAMERTARLAFAAVLSLSALSASAARAAYVVNIEEVGANVVETGSGRLDLVGLPLNGTTTNTFAFLSPNPAGYGSGPSGAKEAQFISTISATLSGPTQWGPGAGGFLKASSSSGDGVGITIDPSGGEDNAIFVPAGYDGGFLSETSTYLKESLASMGLTPGTYVYNFGGPFNADTFTVIVGVAGAGAIPEPSTWALMLMGFAGLGYATFRRKAAPAVVG
jgi:hypothetical protein